MSEYTNIVLTTEQWRRVLAFISESENSEKYMFILRCWANGQVVTNASYLAFEGLVAEDLTDRKTASFICCGANRAYKRLSGRVKKTWTICGASTFES